MLSCNVRCRPDLLDDPVPLMALDDRLDLGEEVVAVRRNHEARAVRADRLVLLVRQR